MRIFFPLKCPVCKEIIPITKTECTCCGDEVNEISLDFCPHCARDKENCLCKIENSSELSAVASVYYYSGIIKSKIMLFKFSAQKHFAGEFSLAMAQRAAKVFSEVDFDFVTFVPSSRSTILERGYNQSELLAKGVAERLFLPAKEVLFKTRETEFQHKLSAKDRASNLLSAFEAKDVSEIKGKTVLLCDDIKTTGATLKECENVLFRAGAKAVYCITLAVSDFSKDPF